MGARTDDGVWLIEWHTNGALLSYAVINGPSPNMAEGHIHVEHDSGKTNVYLLKPDGTKVSILDSHRVFQISDTNVIEAQHPISAAAFTTFIHSSPKDYSLSALLKFSEAQK